MVLRLTTCGYAADTKWIKGVSAVNLQTEQRVNFIAKGREQGTS